MIQQIIFKIPTCTENVGIFMYKNERMVRLLEWFLAGFIVAVVTLVVLESTLAKN